MNPKNSVTYPKINGNVCFEKNQVKIKVTRYKLAENIFPVQYRWKQPNFTANKPKHVFPAIKLNPAYFKHRKAETLLGLKVT